MKLEDRLNEAGTPIGIHRVSFKGDVVNNIAEKDSRTEAREAIYKDLDTLLGKNEPIDVGRYENGRDMWGKEWARLHNAEPKARNNHRAELRNKLKGYCGVEG